MTKFQALFIKYLRIKNNCTWRSVAANYYNRYNEDGTMKPYKERIIFEYFTIGGNQLTGRWLCDEAMKLLNETVEKGWN